MNDIVAPLYYVIASDLFQSHQQRNEAKTPQTPILSSGPKKYFEYLKQNKLHLFICQVFFIYL